MSREGQIGKDSHCNSKKGKEEPMGCILIRQSPKQNSLYIFVEGDILRLPNTLLSFGVFLILSARP